MEIKRAMMISVGCRDWNLPKMIFVPTDGKYGKKLEEVAKEAYLECQEAIQEAIDNGEIFEVEEILRCELGLEPDYIFNFI